MLSYNEEIKILKSATELLEEAIFLFHEKIGPPRFITEPNKERFEYAEPTSLHFQFLKAVRIVSGLNAIMRLIEEGYEQEIGVLTRTIYDFIHEINYVQEAHETGKLTAGQQKIINDFFKSNLKTYEEWAQENCKRSEVIKKKIRASIARILGKFTNPHRIQKMQEYLDNIYSEYVHGSYPSIMTLCSGCSDAFGNIRTKFSLRGGRVDDCMMLFVGLVHRSLNTFGVLALNFGLSELKEKVIAKRKEIEDKDIYDPKPKVYE